MRKRSASCAAAEKDCDRSIRTGRPGTPAPIRTSSAIRVSSGGRSSSSATPTSQRSEGPVGRKTLGDAGWVTE